MRRGYAMSHKYSRVSMKATKNYYRLLQIAHLINQLFELQQKIKTLYSGKMTLAQWLIDLLTQFRAEDLDEILIHRNLRQNLQIRFP